jgi:hypothetical protein
LGIRRKDRPLIFELVGAVLAPKEKPRGRKVIADADTV